jgi:sugar phosphate isomerase/epimerase
VTASDRLRSRLGLNVPYEWWPAAALLKSFEAARFGWTQIPSPPPSVLSSPRECLRHARGVAAALDSTGLDAIVHGPGSISAGRREDDRALEGLLAYSAEAGAGLVVYHGRNFPDEPNSEDLALAETRSLARLARLAERLGLTIAVENLAPVFPGPERLGHTPMLLRALCRRISSPSLGLCLDLGHAHIVADCRHAQVGDLLEPVLDAVVLFHLHDNLGARRSIPDRPDLDPLRLDLHLPPGRGTMPWIDVAALLRDHRAPLILEIHPPHRPDPAVLQHQTLGLLRAREAAPTAAG